MALAAAISILAGSFVFLVLAVRARRNVRTIADYCTYPIHLSPRKLGFTLAATNVSLITVYVSLAAMGAASGLIAVWTPLIFCAGMAIFPFFFPRMATFWRKKQRLPEAVAALTGSQRLRRFTALLAVLGLFIFYYVEIWGLAFILRGLITDGPLLRVVIVLLAGIVPVYVCIAGFRVVVDTDIVQLIAVFAVTGILACATFFLFGKTPDDLAALLERIGVASSRGDPGSLWSSITHAWPAYLQLMVTMVFAQVIYYDNWHRLEAFYHSRMVDLLGVSFRELNTSDNETVEKRNTAEAVVLREAKLQYWIAAASLLLLFYIWPAIYGLLFYRSGISIDAASLLSMLPFCLTESSPIQAILVGVLSFGLFAAALSTADTYLLCMTTTIHEDLLRRPLREDQACSFEDWSKLPPVFSRDLLPLRVIVVVFGGLAFAGVEANLDPTTLLSVLFASQNGLLPVLLAGLLKWRVRPLAAISAMLLPYAICIIALVYPSTKWGQLLTEWLGVVVLGASCLVTIVGLARQKGEGR